MKLGEYVKNQFYHDDVGATIVYGNQDEKNLDALIEHFSQADLQSFVHEISPINILHENYKQVQRSEEGYYFLDCETDGLYGSFLSAAILSVDGNQKVETVHYLYHLPETVTNDFAKKTVLPKLEGHEETIRKTLDLDADIEISICKVKDEEELVTEAGKILSENLDRKIYAEHLFPVEYRFSKKLKVSLERLVEIGLPIKPVATKSDSEKDAEENLEKENYLTQHKKPNYQHTAWYDVYQSMKQYLPPFSSHVFILPFELKNFKGDVLRGDWQPTYDAATGSDTYKDTFLKIPYQVGNRDAGKDEALHYNFNTYFNQEVKSIIKNHAKHYHYKHDKELYYHINLYDGDGASGQVYTLSVNYIMLRLLEDEIVDKEHRNPDSQTGFLIISLDNDLYRDEQSIAYINQFGRRIYDPYKLSKYADYESPRNLYLTESPNLDTVIANSSRKEENKPAGEIKDAIASLFYAAFGDSETIDLFPDEAKGGKVTIERVIDDRMFVMSHYAFSSVESLLASYANFNDLDVDTAKELYRYTYVDKDSSSCQSSRMLKEILPRSLYDRWVSWNTVYGITQHSMIMLTNESVPSFLIGYFYTQYLEMILWVLTQRVGILRFSALASNQSETGKANELLQLQKNYVRFKNQYLLPELTPQEQGVELYDMMQENLYINKQKVILDEQIESLYEIGQTEQNQRLNVFVLLLSCLTVITAFSDFTGSLNTVLTKTVMDETQVILVGLSTGVWWNFVLLAVYVLILLFLGRVVFGLTFKKLKDVIKSSRF